MSLAVNVLSCLSDTEDALTPLEIARWLIDYDTDHEDDDEGDLKEEVEDELQSLVDNDLVVKSGRRYLITAQGTLALAEATKRPRVFLVHGHDHVLLYKCKDLILKEFEGEFDDVVILQDKPTRGSESLHDKLMRYAPTKGDLAVVLMTADDVGASRKEAGRPRPRARQNATFEMGLPLRQHRPQPHLGPARPRSGASQRRRRWHVHRHGWQLDDAASRRHP